MAISISVLSRGPLGVLLALFKSVLLWLLVPVKRVPVAAYRRPSELTPAETAILRMPAVRLAEAIRERRISSEHAVNAYIKRIREVNPLLNLVVKDRFVSALAEAKAIDERIKTTTIDAEQEPFLGVPCTVKESIAVKGMPHTAGFVPRTFTHNQAAADATVIERMRAAGCVILGVTNTSELCFFSECNNHVYGRSLNPFDPTRTTGGSSGGEGGIIGAGGSVIGLGSDIGGSIRFPANFNGIFGHKPSAGYVPTTGHFPARAGRASMMSVIGPICRYAEDLYPVMKVISGPNGVDINVRPQMVLQDPATVDLKRVRIFSWPNDTGKGETSPVVAEIQEKQRAALRHLIEAAGCQQGDGPERAFDCFKESAAMWLTTLGAQPPPTGGDIAGVTTIGAILREMVKIALGTSIHNLDAMLVLLGAWIERTQTTPAEKQRLLAAAEKLEHDLTDMLGEDGVILYPVYPTPAPKHGDMIFRALDFSYSGIWNMLLFPATVVPLGLSAGGIPLGIQVIGARGQDHLTLAVASELERAFGGWRAPPVRPLKA